MLTTLSWSVHNSNIRLCCIPLESIIHLQSWALVVALWCTASSTWKSVWKLEMKVVASRIIPRIEKLCLTQQGSHVLVSDCGHLKLKLQTHVHWVGDAIWLSYPLLPSSPFAFKSFPASGSFPVSHMNTSFPSPLFYFLTIFTISRLNIALWLRIVSSPLPLHKSDDQRWKNECPSGTLGLGVLLWVVTTVQT